MTSRSGNLLLLHVPAAMSSTPWYAADRPAAVPRTAAVATAGRSPTPTGGRHPRTIRHAAWNSTSTSRLRQLFVVNIFARAHGTTNNDGWDGRVVVGAAASPPNGAQHASTAKAMIALVSQAPGRLKFQEGLETQVALPPLSLHLFSNSLSIFGRHGFHRGASLGLPFRFAAEGCRAHGARRGGLLTASCFHIARPAAHRAHDSS